MRRSQRWHCAPGPSSRRHLKSRGPSAGVPRTAVNNGPAGSIQLERGHHDRVDIEKVRQDRLDLEDRLRNPPPEEVEKVWTGPGLPDARKHMSGDDLRQQLDRYYESCDRLRVKPNSLVVPFFTAAEGERRSELNLRNNLLGAYGTQALLEALRGDTQLETLVLSNNNLRSRSTKALADNLVYCPSLRCLDITNNQIADDGYPHLIRLLRNCPAITELDVSGNRLGHDSLRRIATARRRNQEAYEADLSKFLQDQSTEISALTEELLVKVMSYLSVRELKVVQTVSHAWAAAANSPVLWRDIVISPEFPNPNEALRLMARKYGSHVRSVQLSENATVDDIGIAVLGKCPKLEIVNLAGCTGIGYAGLKFLALCPNLTRINVADCPGVSDSSLDLILHAALTGAEFGVQMLPTKCESLNISNTGVSDRSVCRIGQLANSLTMVNLCNLGSAVTDEAVLNLSYCPHLRLVNLAGSVVSDSGVEALSYCANLESLSVSNTLVTDACGRPLSKAPCLRELNIAECKGITDVFFRYLKRSVSLQHIDMSFNDNITDAGVQELTMCESVKSMVLTGLWKLSHLSLWYASKEGNALESIWLDGCDGIDGAHLDCLRNCTALTYLSVKSCMQISPEHVRFLKIHHKSVSVDYKAAPDLKSLSDEEADFETAYWAERSHTMSPMPTS